MATGKFILVVSDEIVIVKADPSDNKFLEAAVAREADLVVSGDKHLLELKEFRSIPILSAHEFLGRLETDI